MVAVFYGSCAGPKTARPLESDEKSKEDLKRALTRFQERLEHRLNCAPEELVENSASSEGNYLLTPANFNRRLFLSTDQPFDLRIMRLNRLYHKESKVLETSQDIAISGMLACADRSDKAALNCWTMPQLLSAYHNEVRRQTDRLTEANEYTLASSDSPAPAGRSIELEFAELLEDFFVNCQVPNKAEIAMLSEICDESPAWIRQWFIEKRTQVVWLVNKEDIFGTKGQQ